MQNVVNILRKKDLIVKNKPDPDKVLSMGLRQIEEIIHQIETDVESSISEYQRKIFSFASSPELGGSGFLCRYHDCRLNKIKQLARFAALYSDVVFILNFLSGFEYEPNLTSDQEFFVRESFYEDLLVISEILPLLESGRIRLVNPILDVCFTCQAKEFLGPQAGILFDSKYKALQKKYLNNMTSCCYLQEDICFECNGPQPYFDHEIIVTYPKTHPEISLRPNILKKIEEGKTVPLTKKAIEEQGLHAHFAHNTVSSSFDGIATSSLLGTAFLTDSDIDIEFLNMMQPSYKIIERNSIALEHLSSIVPFLEDLDIEDVLKVRDREEEAFIRFRNSLNSAIGNFQSESGNFTKKRAEELYSDILMPELAYLDQKVRLAKKDLLSKPIKSLLGVVGVISFGLFSGLIKEDLASIAKAIGFLKFGSDFVKDLISVKESEKSITLDDYYFLWKIRKRNKK